MRIRRVGGLRRPRRARRLPALPPACVAWILGLILLALTPPAAGAQQPPQAGRDTAQVRPADTETAGEADYDPGRRTLIKGLDFSLGFTTVHIGGGFLYDGAVPYQRNPEAQSQFALNDTTRYRDIRFLFGGKFRTKRPLTWQFGVMYDQTLKKWVFRQSGLMLAVPEINSHFFLGRAKEGFSLNKVMVGYDGWGMERMPFTDATIPLLADGIKWLGNADHKHIFWNLGWFNDRFSQGQTFSSYNYQFVLRTGWVPMQGDTSGTLLHLGLNLRYGQPDHGRLKLSSKPEVFPSPLFLNTGSFPADGTWTGGVEAYYRPGSFLIGSEVYTQHVLADSVGNPWFYGGNIVISWLPTGEVRRYEPVGNYFRGILPRRTVIQGGPGAWELVLTMSYANFTDRAVHGGIFWRVTPMLNIHLSDNVRLEFAYGYGKLDRFGVTGAYSWVQSRVQLQL